MTADELIRSLRERLAPTIGESAHFEARLLAEAALHTGDPVRVEDAITHPAVEAEVLERVRIRARAHAPRVETPDQIAALYAEWIIPLSRKIQVHGLLAHG